MQGKTKMMAKLLKIDCDHRHFFSFFFLKAKQEKNGRLYPPKQDIPVKEVKRTKWKVCVFCFFFYYPCSRLGARRLQIERPWGSCLCGQLKQGGGDSSRALWGHLWNRLTNVSLLCHKDTRLTKLAINAPFTTHLFVTKVFISSTSYTVLAWLTRPKAILKAVLKRGQPFRDRTGWFSEFWWLLPLLLQLLWLLLLRGRGKHQRWRWEYRLKT